jgi:hypothetical protein
MADGNEEVPLKKSTRPAAPTSPSPGLGEFSARPIAPAASPALSKPARPQR